MSDALKAALRRFARVFIAGALVGGVAALRGDAEFAQYLVTYAWAVPVIAFVGKFLRDKYGFDWLPI